MPKKIPTHHLRRCLYSSVDSSTASTLCRVFRNSSSCEGAVQERSRLYSTSFAFKSYRDSISPESTSAPKRVRILPANLDRLDHESIHNLHEKLQNLGSDAEPDGSIYLQTYSIVKHLITVRKEEPSALHYEALLRVNASAKFGSANAVWALMQEMDELEIPKDTAIYHAALLALSIHPDYLLRAEILAEMKKRWFGLSPDGWHHLVVGLIRDRQYEVAMDEIEKMHGDNIEVKPWLYKILISQLCEALEFDQAFELFKFTYNKRGHVITDEWWYFMLDAFGKGLHYEGVKFIWEHRVLENYISPSDGMLSAVLNIAARHSDPQLGISATRMLSKRSAIAPHHYEALIEAYAKSKDLKTAFRILAIMEKAGMKPDATNTRPIYLYLLSNPRLPTQAFQVLEDLYADGHPVPLASVNVIIEACANQKNPKLGIEIYKKLHIISVSPNTSTFNHLLQGLARHIEGKSLGMFLAAEMGAWGVKPDELTYDRLILICINQPDYEDAFRYLEEMVHEGKGKNEGKGWWMRPGTAREVALVAITQGDKRAFEIQQEMSRRGIEIPDRKTKVKNRKGLFALHDQREKGIADDEDPGLQRKEPAV